MGREVRRVPLDFDWPLKKEWEPEILYRGEQQETRSLPPEGPGWQMWENTSEFGSPISPVFKTPEDLARWLADSGTSAFAFMTATYEEWLAMIEGPGYSFSGGTEDGNWKSGVALVGRRKR